MSVSSDDALYAKLLNQHPAVRKVLDQLSDRFRGRADATLYPMDPRDLGLADTDALSFVLYCLDDERWELLWNARNGSTPSRLRIASTGELAPRVPLSMFAPNYVPSIGERVFVDLTEVRARQKVVEQLVELEQEQPAQYAVLMQTAQRKYASREEYVASEVARLRSVYSFVGDVISVTAGWLESLAHARTSGQMPIVVERSELTAYKAGVVEAGGDLGKLEACEFVVGTEFGSLRHRGKT